MSLTHVEILETIEVIWNAQLGWQASQADVMSMPPIGNDVMTGCVHITGAWRGAVVLVCPRPMVRQAAGKFFDLPESEMQNEQIQDTLGELTNMIAGNLKALLPERCFISLPAVVDGSSYGLRIPESEVFAFLPLRTREHSFQVSMLEAKD